VRLCFYPTKLLSATSELSSDVSSVSVFILVFLYLFNPVPAGISLPIITFSFNPINGSTFPFIAASVKTLVVSWNDAADKKLSVASAAFVIPRSARFPVAGLFPYASALAFCSSYS
jgi:hypothetical protein